VLPDDVRAVVEQLDRLAGCCAQSLSDALRADVTQDELRRLVSLLTECVHGGASIGCVAPLAYADAETY